MTQGQALSAQVNQLEGCTRDFSALARKLPRGKSTECTVHKANVYIETLDKLCTVARFELVADRFLRRQVRTLVATALYTASAEAHLESSLFERVTSGDQKRTAHPAPPWGLFLAEVGY